MACDKKQLVHWMNSQMTREERESFEIHLAQCESCREEFKTSKQVWDLLEQVHTPEPSPAMKMRFQGVLDAYRQSLEDRNNLWQRFTRGLHRLWSLQPRFQLAYSIVLVLTGIVIGFALNRQGAGSNKQQLTALSSQVEEMRQVMMLSLVENPSASKRLEAVSYTGEVSSLNVKVIDALLSTLNEDPNINVRLATLEALVKFSAVPRVREGLVQSITQQESPLVQSAMVDAMLQLQEKSSVKPLQQLLDKKDLNENVKLKIEKGIHQLI
jgi:predicted anti-sigma-YlaC factor YlaD